MGKSTKAERRSKVVKLDGRVGEGGGQIIRVALSLSSITGTPISIDHVRANRARGGRGGGLKAQHVSCVKYLAIATAAEVADCAVGSKTIEFTPNLSPAHIVNRDINIKSDSAGSVLLIFQALLPFLVFASTDVDTPVNLTIEGGTNVCFSPSYEYVDQVLLPSLERFGVQAERELMSRGWSQGSRQIGCAKFKIKPLPFGRSLAEPAWPSAIGDIVKVDISVIVPQVMHDLIRRAFRFKLSVVFPEAETNTLLVEDSKHTARMYALLVAHTSTGLRFGHDWLYDKTSKNKSPDSLSTEIAKGVVDGLDRTVRKGGLVDEHLQDQLIVFQALAEGQSTIPGSLETATSNRSRIERADEPFGDGSAHTTTARWVASQLLPTVRWMDKGRLCEGAGWKNEISEMDEGTVDVQVN